MQTESATVPTFADVAAAADRISSRLLRTPVMSSAALDKRADRRVVFKCENLQHGGAFKYRGALNAILPLAMAGNVIAVATQFVRKSWHCCCARRQSLRPRCLRRCATRFRASQDCKYRAGRERS